MIQKYELKKIGDINVLHKAGKQLFCPFKPSIIIPGQIQGQAVLHREPCGDHCPLFREVLTGVQLECSKNNTILKFD